MRALLSQYLLRYCRFKNVIISSESQVDSCCEILQHQFALAVHEPEQTKYVILAGGMMFGELTPWHQILLGVWIDFECIGL